MRPVTKATREVGLKSAELCPAYTRAKEEHTNAWEQGKLRDCPHIFTKNRRTLPPKMDSKQSYTAGEKKA